MKFNMFDFLPKSDSTLKHDVISECKWDPRVDLDDIDVRAVDGVVTLRGTVAHFIEKKAAELATLRVGGVRGVANELKVKLLGANERKDDDIARNALLSLDWTYQVPDGITVAVNNGWITLRGIADWDFERTAAKFAVSSLMGVTGVTNDIKLSTRVHEVDVKKEIEQALLRTAKDESRQIEVLVTGNDVTLNGIVNSLAEMESIKQAVWNAPGVQSLANNLKLSN